ncbi:MAG TPA: HNH endonuclease signature motif containing protein [Methanosarcina sp.]|nr:HNH endonuclease signature motif containing protein [Methanosarcina sp.]
MTSKPESIKEWRDNTKAKMVASMGGCCQICGYDKCNKALELHHLNPAEKEISLSQALARPKKWEYLELEITKCILLCSNCHREFHAGVTSIPDTFQRYDASLIPKKLLKGPRERICPLCEGENKTANVFCSKECAGKYNASRRFDWSGIDIVDLVDTQKLSYVAISKLVGCSDVSVKKRYVKIKKQSS